MDLLNNYQVKEKSWEHNDELPKNLTNGEIISLITFKEMKKYDTKHVKPFMSNSEYTFQNRWLWIQLCSRQE